MYKSLDYWIIEISLFKRKYRTPYLTNGLYTLDHCLRPFTSKTLNYIIFGPTFISLISQSIISIPLICQIFCNLNLSSYRYHFHLLFRYDYQEKKCTCEKGYHILENECVGEYIIHIIQTVIYKHLVTRLFVNISEWNLLKKHWFFMKSNYSTFNC